MNQLHFFLVSFLCCLGFYSYSQYELIYGGTGNDFGVGLQYSSNDEILLVGYSNSAGSGSNDGLLTKMNKDGGIIWSKLYGNSGRDEFYWIKETKSGNYVTGGRTYSFAGSTEDFYVNMIDTSGQVLWSKTYGGSGNEMARDLLINENGTFSVVGYADMGMGNKDYLLINIDSLGNLLWAKTYGNLFNDFPHDITSIPGGGYLITGYRRNYSSTNHDLFSIKTDSLGNVIWAKAYSTNGYQVGNQGTYTGDGYLMAAVSDVSRNGKYDVLLVKTDTAGKIRWSKTYGTNSNELEVSVSEDGYGNFVAVCYSDGLSNGNNDLLAFKVNTAGDLIWSTRYGGNADEKSYKKYSSLILPDQRLVYTGMTESYGAGGQDVYVVMTESNGYVGCERKDAVISVNTIDLTATDIDVGVTTPMVNVGSLLTKVSDISFENLFVPGQVSSNNDSLTIVGDTLVCNGVATELNTNLTGINYIWSTGETSKSIEVIDAGKYAVSMQDSLGCWLKDTLEIVLKDFDVNIKAATEFGCDRFGSTTVKLTASADGGVPPYSFLWQPGGETTDSLIGKTGVNYVTVTDSIGCMSIDSIEVLDLINIEIVKQRSESCSGCANGEIEVTVSGGLPPYTYRWSLDDQTSAAITGLINGVYTVIVTDQNGCSRLIEINLEPIGVDEKELGFRLKVYPNPTSGIFKVESDFINVYDSQGRYLLSTSGPVVDLTQYGKGMYLIRARIKEQIIYSKVVLK